MTDFKSRARLPKAAIPPSRVFVNGVPQTAGKDYAVEGEWLMFTRPLAKEGKLGFWRWLVMSLGIAGFYGKNDSVDVQYEVGGELRLANGLELEPLEDEAG